MVGLGHIAQTAVLPAFGHAKGYAKLVALISGDPEKRDGLAEMYGIPDTHSCTYEHLGSLLEAGEVDAIYIATPNDQHRQWVELAAAHGVHVLCEKPLAMTCADAEAMVSAADVAGITLMTAYRLHLEEATVATIAAVQAGKLGALRYFSACFSMNIEAPNVRLDPKEGGGPLWDIGVYCINAARNLFEAEPLRVSAIETGVGFDERFTHVPMTVSATLEFSQARVAQFTASFGAADVSEYRIVGVDGHIRVEPAFEYAEGLITHRTVGTRKSKKDYRKSDQFAAELVYFVECIREGRRPEPDGEEGLLDLRVIEAIVTSARENRVVTLTPRIARRRPHSEQAIHRPAVSKPPTQINASGPRGD